uniref:tyrosine--tRNA ligase n=1 Tax=Plectus sambesii TaxID=2011161 RepID=A0A914UPB2_9BILA
MLTVYKLASHVERDAAREAGVAIVKQIEFPMLSTLLCPLFQAADEEHLEADVHFGGADLTKCFELAEKILPKIDCARRTHLTCELVPGVVGPKMSASLEESILDPLDGGKALKNRLKKAFCEPGNVADNPPLAFTKAIIFPLLVGQPFLIPRAEKHGGEISIPDAATAEKSFAEEQLHPGDLKLGVESFFNDYLEPVRAEFALEDAQKMFLAAFPPPEKKGKAAKSQKKPPAKS